MRTKNTAIIATLLTGLTLNLSLQQVAHASTAVTTKTKVSATSKSVKSLLTTEAAAVYLYRCPTKKKSASSYYMLIRGAARGGVAGSKNDRAAAYLLRVNRGQVLAAEASALSYASALRGTDMQIAAGLRGSITGAIGQFIRGAQIATMADVHVAALLGGLSLRLGGTALYADAGDDVIGSVLALGGGLTGVAEKFGTGAAGVSPAELWGAGTMVEIAGTGVATAGAAYAGYKLGRGILDAAGANDGHTLGDALFDAWSSLTGDEDDTSAPSTPAADTTGGTPGDATTTGGSSSETSTSPSSSGSTGSGGSSAAGSSSSSGSGSSGGDSEGGDGSETSHNQDDDENGQSTDSQSADDQSTEGQSSGGVGTSLPPDFQEGSDPARLVGFLLTMGLFTKSGLSRTVVTRPVVLAGTPTVDGQTTTTFNVMSYLDALFGGIYFKGVKRTLDARRNGAGTPADSLGETNGSVSPSDILVDYRGCPSPEQDVSVFDTFVARQLQWQVSAGK